MHKIYLEKIDLNMHKSKIEDIIDMLMCDAKNNDHELYEHIEGEMYEMAYGKKISEEVALNWVESMKPYGQKWSMEETTRAMRDRGWNLDPVDFYVVANMMFNDYNNIVLDNVELALELAKDWLKDTDAKEHKLYNYYKYIV